MGTTEDVAVSMRRAAFDAGWEAAMDLRDDPGVVEHYKWARFAGWWVPLTKEGARWSADFPADRAAWSTAFQTVFDGVAALVEVGRSHGPFMAMLAERRAGAAWGADGELIGLPPVPDAFG